MKNLLYIIISFLICFVAIYLDSPSYTSSNNSNDFSIENTMAHIDVMAQENHFMGTEENRKVRDYILSEFQKLNIQAEIFDGYTSSNWRNRFLKMAKTENIIATIKGNGNGKAVLIAGHYDSVLSAPGAADDVHAVACILESARLLKNMQHKNDIIFLITDGEEMGLLGAKAFTEMEDLSNIGLVLNYEARGNSGSSISFEWSEGNAWLVQQVKKAGINPIANSMSYEIYNRLPNDTDFTYFKKAGLSGINHAFIDGFSYYHNPVDNPETINKKSVKHTGENMYHLVKHFANIDITNTVSHNASFFNFLTGIISYPSSMDIFFLIFTLLLVVVCVVFAMRAETSIKSISIAFSYIILLLVLCIGSMIFLSSVLPKLYPQYNVFYSGQFYNHKWYLLTSVSTAIIFTWFITNYFNFKNKANAFKSAAIFVLSIFAIAMYMFLPTATYFMSFPIMALAFIYILNGSAFIKNKNILDGITFLLLIVPLIIWTPIIQNIFLAFSIKMLANPAVLTSFTCLATFIAFESIWTKNKSMLYIGLFGFFFSLIVAHLTSKPTEEKPLPSSVFYHYNLNDQTAHWATNQNDINIGNRDLLKGAKIKTLKLPRTESIIAVENKLSPSVSCKYIISDSTQNSVLSVQYDQEAYLTNVYFENTQNLKWAKINGKTAFENRTDDIGFYITLFGMTQDSLNLEISKIDSTQSQTVTINNEFMVLPQKDIIPKTARRVDGYTSLVKEVRM
ncbi:MAG: M28 family peptidase [Saprospiraceae bacterium]|nr:M28 family peptidase [Saprospiraceae bacterium]